MCTDRPPTSRLLSIALLIGFNLNINAQITDWANQLGGAFPDYGRSSATDDNGNVYTLGSFVVDADLDPGDSVFTLTSAGGYDIFISKSNASGDFLWAVQLGGPGDDFGFHMTTDAMGNIYTTGTFTGTADFDPGSGSHALSSQGSEDVFICKLDALGNFIWVKQFGGAGADFGYSIALDAVGNVLTTGTFTGTVDFDPGIGTFELISAGFMDAFISKLDPSGNYLWAKQLGGSGDDFGRSIALDNSGNVFTTGRFWATADFDPGSGIYNLTSFGDYDVFISKLDPLGEFIWAKQFGGSNRDIGYSVTTDLEGNVYTTGQFAGTVDFDPLSGLFILTSNGDFDVFTSKSDASGNVAWAKKLGGIGTDIGYAITVDHLGNVYTTGQFWGTGDFDPGSNLFNLVSNGSSDVFISHLSAQGTFVWAQHFGGVSDDIGYSIILNDSGSLFTTGIFEDVVDFDPGSNALNLISNGGSDVFVHRMNTISVALVENNYLEGISVYPNPTEGELKIDLGLYHPTIMVKVYNSIGQEICQRFYHDKDRIELTIEGDRGLYAVTLGLSETTVPFTVLKE